MADSLSTPTSLPRVDGLSANGTTPPPPLEEGPNPFNAASLRLAQDFGTALDVQRPLTHVPVRKPAKEWFVRVHPDPAFHLPTTMIELKETNELYLVAPALRPYLAKENTFVYKQLFTAITRQGTVFLWPIPLPRNDRDVNAWTRTALEVAHRAQSAWVRLRSDQEAGAYFADVAAYGAEPVWPRESFDAMLVIAFKDRYIASLDHTVLRQLSGEV